MKLWQLFWSGSKDDFVIDVERFWSWRQNNFERDMWKTPFVIQAKWNYDQEGIFMAIWGGFSSRSTNDFCDVPLKGSDHDARKEYFEDNPIKISVMVSNVFQSWSKRALSK